MKISRDPDVTIFECVFLFIFYFQTELLLIACAGADNSEFHLCLSNDSIGEKEKERFKRVNLAQKVKIEVSPKKIFITPSCSWLSRDAKQMFIIMWLNIDAEVDLLMMIGVIVSGDGRFHWLIKREKDKKYFESNLMAENLGF